MRKALHKANLSQAELAENLGIGLRTADDIESYRSNLTIETLSPLIRTLNIDPAEIFYPEHANITSGAVAEIKALLALCTEEEAILMRNIFEAVLHTVRSLDAYSIYKQK